MPLLLRVAMHPLAIIMDIAWLSKCAGQKRHAYAHGHSLMKHRVQTVCMALCLAFTATAIAADATGLNSATGAPPVALITGADRRLGFALTQELVARGWHVIATCRTPDRAMELKAFATAHPGVSIEKLDVADNAAIDTLSATLHGQPIDALVNNAGIAGELGARSPEAISPQEFERVLRVNTYAPLRLARVLLPNIAASGQKKIVSVSSGIGSLTKAPDYMQYAPAYFYAISKAGLNMEMRMLATELKPRGVLVGLVTPGMVDTAMQAQYRSASVAVGTPITAPMLTPAQSARGVVDFIIGLNAQKSGRLFGYTGVELPW